MRKSNRKTTVKALLIGAFFFSLAVSAPLIISLIPKSTDDEDNSINEVKLTNVKLPPKKVEPPKLNAPPPPPPPPAVDQVKFVKPVVAKAEEVVEEIAGFPFMSHDDLVDSTVMALMRFRQGGFLRLPTDEPEDIRYFKQRRGGYY